MVLEDYLYFSPSPSIREYKDPFSPQHYIYTAPTPSDPEKQFRINETGIEVIALFDGTRTYQDIINHLANKHGDPKEVIDAKVAPFIDEMVKRYKYQIIKQHEPTLNEIHITTFKTIYPTVANLEITSKCNIACKHCYGKFDNKNDSEMSLDNVFYLLDSLKEIGLYTLEITGGDPSVHPHAATIINRANEVGIPTIMFLTNGVRITDELFTALEAIKHKLFVQIDLHSLDENYYDWFTNSAGKLKIVKSNIIRLVEAGIRVRVVSIFTQGNVHELTAIGDWAHAHGAKLYAPSVVTGMGRCEDMVANQELFFSDVSQIKSFDDQCNEIKLKYPGFILESALPETNCGAIHSSVSIKSNGDIKLCNMDTGEYFNLDFGNVFSERISTIFTRNQELLQKFREIVMPDRDSDDCTHCESKQYCSACILRGVLSSKRMGGNCKWFEKLDPMIKERLNPYSN